MFRQTKHGGGIIIQVNLVDCPSQFPFLYFLIQSAESEFAHRFGALDFSLLW